jgi:hypothetical protein
MSFMCKLPKQCHWPTWLFVRMVAWGTNLNHPYMTEWGMDNITLLLRELSYILIDKR